MKCVLCTRFFDPDRQSPVCPHLELFSPEPRPGGIRLQPHIQNQIEDAFALRNKGTLEDFKINSLSPAARYYAAFKLKQLEQLEKDENAEPTLHEL